jgi:uncharacterized membrane protein YhaH (DUF805 family)
MKYYISVLSKYAIFSGRARRSEYWYFALFSVLAYLVCFTIDITLGTIYLNSIYRLVVFLPSIAVGVRRMHDVNKSGWYLLIPIYNLILAFTPGTQGHNDYGHDPKGEEFTFEFEKSNQA